MSQPANDDDERWKFSMYQIFFLPSLYAVVAINVAFHMQQHNVNRELSVAIQCVCVRERVYVKLQGAYVAVAVQCAPIMCCCGLCECCMKGIMASAAVAAAFIDIDEVLYRD